MWAYNYVTLYEKNGVHINRTHKYIHSCMYMRSNCIHYIQIYKLMIEMLIKAYNALQVITNLIDNFSHFKSKSSYWMCLDYLYVPYFLIFVSNFFCCFFFVFVYLCYLFVLYWCIIWLNSTQITFLYYIYIFFFKSYKPFNYTVYNYHSKILIK